MARLDYVTFFATLSEEELLLLLECALQGLRDEVTDGFMRDGDALEDISEEQLVSLLHKLNSFMNP